MPHKYHKKGKKNEHPWLENQSIARTTHYIKVVLRHYVTYDLHFTC